jgi:hypothetical protein
MNLRARYLVFAATLLVSGLLISSCGKRLPAGMIIITKARHDGKKNDPLAGASSATDCESHLFMLDPASPGSSQKDLTKAFYSASSPSVSFDASHMLFAAVEKKGDPWQIWEMDLGSGKVSGITSGKENSTDPAYLPGGRIVFSRTVANDSLKSGKALFTCLSDGSQLARITFNPHTYSSSTVLADGRVVTISRRVFPESGQEALMVMRPDGTKSELFYEDCTGMRLSGRSWETADGKVIVTGADTTAAHRGAVVSFRYNRPLHSAVNLSASLKGDICSAFPLESGKLLVSYRESESENYALCYFDSEKKVMGDVIIKDPEMDIVDAVVVKVHDRPKKLPSEVDFGVKTGLLFCQNIGMTGLSSPETASPGAADRLEIMGVDSSLGIVQVEKDGSFYLKVKADMPFRIKTIDAGGKVISGPGAWIWVRPNERRGCAGCHEDQEMVPANRVALAVKNNPVVVPVHVTGVREKKVELE